MNRDKLNNGVFKTLSNILDGAFDEIDGFQTFTVSAKRSILDVWQGSEYAFARKQPSESTAYKISTESRRTPVEGFFSANSDNIKDLASMLRIWNPL